MKYKITFMDGLTTHYDANSMQDVIDCYESDGILKVERVITTEELRTAVGLLRANCANCKDCKNCIFCDKEDETCTLNGDAPLNWIP